MWESNKERERQTRLYVSVHVCGLLVCILITIDWCRVFYGAKIKFAVYLSAEHWHGE